jgi:Ca2+-binding EF-hand superfamily protein
MPSVSRQQLRQDRLILDKIRDKVQGKSKRLGKVFRSFDENHDGVVSHGEFRHGLTSLGVPLSDQEFDRCA